jgi:hypothetical protein
MVSSEMLRRVALVRADVSEDLSTSFIRVSLVRTDVSEELSASFITTLAVTS